MRERKKLKVKYCYVFFVVSGKEDNVVWQLRSLLDLNLFSVFVPMLEKIFKKKELTIKEKVPLFPGYVFVESDFPDNIFREYTMKIIYKINDIIKLLKYGDSEKMSLKENERSSLFILCNASHCIESSSGIIERDRVCIKEGPLKGMESKILKINRHKREALVELRIMGDIRQIKVGLEIVEKIPT